MLLQDSIELFLREEGGSDARQEGIATSCMESLVDYLVQFSDLSPDSEMEMEHGTPDDWELELDEQMHKLLDHDDEPAFDLGNVQIGMLEASHIRDYLGWYLLREAAINEHNLDDHLIVIRRYIKMLRRKRLITSACHQDIGAMIAQLEPECQRTWRAAYLLYHHIRLGFGPANGGGEIEELADGLARLTKVTTNQIWLNCDGEDREIGPIYVPHHVVPLLRTGDVLDVELCLLGGHWRILDMGAIFPGMVHVEAESIQYPEHLC